MRPIAWLGLMLAALAHAAVLAQGTAALGGEPLYCSMWQGIRTFSSPSGYVSHESTWNGITTADDNRGDRWSTSRWQGFETTTVRRRQDR